MSNITEPSLKDDFIQPTLAGETGQFTLQFNTRGARHIWSLSASLTAMKLFLPSIHIAMPDHDQPESPPHTLILTLEDPAQYTRLCFAMTTDLQARIHKYNAEIQTAYYGNEEGPDI